MYVIFYISIGVIDVEPEKPTVKPRKRCVIYSPQVESDEADQRLSKYMRKGDEERDKVESLKRSLSTTADETCEESSTLKYRKKSAVYKEVINKVRRRFLNSDEDCYDLNTFRHLSRDVVKNKTVSNRLRRQLFYTDDSSTDDVSVEIDRRGVKRSLTDTEQRTDVKYIKIDRQSTSADHVKSSGNYLLSLVLFITCMIVYLLYIIYCLLYILLTVLCCVYITGIGVINSYPGYCLVSTIRTDDMLKVYISKHTPTKLYKHLSNWFYSKPNKDNLFGSIPLSSLKPDELKYIINFFSPMVITYLLIVCSCLLF